MIACTSIQTVDAKNSDFKDVSKNNSHYEGISYLTEKGIINGYADNTFKPDRPITRSQTAELFRRALELPIPNNIDRVMKNYKDVTGNHDYAHAIAATYEAGIFTGSNGRFNDGHLSRE